MDSSLAHSLLPPAPGVRFLRSFLHCVLVLFSCLKRVPLTGLTAWGMRPIDRYLTPLSTLQALDIDRVIAAFHPRRRD